MNKIHLFDILIALIIGLVYSFTAILLYFLGGIQFSHLLPLIGWLFIAGFLFTIIIVKCKRMTFIVEIKKYL